jgi:hypothetical protein
MLGNFALLAYEQEKSSLRIEQARRDARVLPAAPFVAWGEQYLYPVLAKEDERPDYRIYALDSGTLTPYYVSVSEAAAGRDFLSQLQSLKGVTLVMGPEKIEFLKIYCSEHFETKLEVLVEQSTLRVNLTTVRCAKLASM